MRTIQFREAVCEAMSEEMRRDESIYLIGEEVAEYNGAYKASKGMLDEFGPKRVIDAPIAELGFAGIAVGSAMNGNRPIVEFMTFNFSLVGIDQIINNAAKMRQMSGGQFPMPMVFRGPTASAGQLGATHSQAFENWFANTPGLKVVVPSTPYDAKGLLKAAIRDNDPVIFMESEQMYGDKMEIPEGYTYVMGGEYETRQESFAGFNTVIIVTVFLFIAVLILLFKTFKSTIIVLSVIPLGMVGALIALWITGNSLSFVAIIGLIALAGIEVKTSILLVDFTNQLRQEGKPLDEAIREAGEVRFLPIVLTTITAIGGLVPIALSTNPLISPLAIVLIGGLISSTVLSRVVTPVMYKLLPPKI